METEHAAAPPSPEVVRVLVENHERFLSFLERRVGRRDLAEEILQEAFVRSLDRGGELRREEAAIPWFYRLLRNAVTDHFRRGAAEARALEAFGAEPNGPDELLEAVCACVGSLVDTLKPEHAEILRAVELEGASLAAYAARAGITANNAAVRAHRAREALRRQVARACGTCTTHGCLDCSCAKAPR